MDFNQFREKLEHGLNRPLPGIAAQNLMAPEGRPLTDVDKLDQTVVRKAAVLALFFEEEQTAHLVLTLRKRYEGVHSNQISFPGGRREQEDESYLHTAMREAREEIGIAPAKVKVYGQLSPLYIPPSNFLVYPFVGIYEHPPRFIKQESEVEEIFTVSLLDLLSTDFIENKPINVRGVTMEVPSFQFKGYTVWGATAMMLSELRHLLLTP